VRRAAVLLPLLLGPALARAAGDYDPSSADWNGLSNLVALAASEGLTVVPTNELEWSDIGKGDALFILYPKNPIEPAHLMSFLRAGGRLLIADDYGQARDSLSRLNMLRKAEPVHAEKYHENHDGLPIARAVDHSHPLADGVSSLYTNYPAYFQVQAGPEIVFEFGKGEAVVVAGSVGDGRFVALGDPSILINAMLAFDENVQFAANLLAFLRPPPDQAGDRPTRIILLTGDFLEIGAPPVTIDSRPAGTLNDLLRDFSKFLDEMNDYLASGDALWGISMVGATLFLVLVALLLLPSSTSRDLDGSWTRARTAEDRGFVDFERFVAFFETRGGAAPGSQATFAYPAGVLRDGLEQKLGELCGIEQPLALPTNDLYARLQGVIGPRAARHLIEDLLPRLLALPTRAQAQSPWGARFVGWKEFSAAHDAAQAFEAYSQSGPPG
jgi:hypothetical protein